MEFHEKLQQLRKEKGLTQEELARALFVSRTAVSKWESGKGYPNIDSLKALSAQFSVTVDQLLDSDQLLTLAQADTKQKEARVRDLVYGLLDVSTALLAVLPLFGQKISGSVEEVSLLFMTTLPPYLRIAYAAILFGLIVTGLLTLTLQTCQHPFWLKTKAGLSVGLTAIGVLIFIVSRQPYAATLLFAFLVIKTLLLIRRA